MVRNERRWAGPRRHHADKVIWRRLSGRQPPETSRPRPDRRRRPHTDSRDRAVIRAVGMHVGHVYGAGL